MPRPPPPPRASAAPAASESLTIGALVGAAQGDGATRALAERELVERFKAYVRRLLTRTLGPFVEIEDPMQEVFFRLFRALPKVRPPEALPGYVTSVTVNVAHETLRKRRRSRWLSFFAADELAEIAGSAADVSEEMRDFYLAAAKLSPEAHLSVTLRHIEGMSLDEMSAILGVSLATVKRRLTSAEQELAALLGCPQPPAPLRWKETAE